ncbi:MAG TPA: ABC transporter ATP-binding protein [Gemmatimonadaceae bacterium]|nr:ABC transporter ATP-binding protein [Gemmatimonadaceae bacterium]
MSTPPPTLRARVSALRYVPPFIALIWRTNRLLCAAMIILRVARAATPLATLWVAKLIIDTVVHARAVGPHPSWSRLWSLVALEIAIVLGDQAISRASTLVESLLGDLFTNHVSILIMEHAATLDLAQFENAQFYDTLERARQNSTARLTLLGQVLSIGQSTLTLISLGGALVAFNPWLLVLLVLAILPSFVSETHYSRRAYSLFFGRTEGRRMLEYLRYLGAGDRSAKEVQMFALSPWLIDRFRTLSRQFYEENKALAVRRALVSGALPMLGTLGYYVAYLFILADAARGLITIGTLTFLASSFSSSRAYIQGILATARDIYEQTLYLRDLFVFFEITPTIVGRPAALTVPRPIERGFTFEDVGYQYQESDRWAIRHISFTLHAGERLAVVGENGAGKTTLTKLLTRLYDPTEGRILLDGVDLREYDIGDLRRAIGVIFQDFIRYDLRFDENIGLGEIELARHSLDANPPAPTCPAIEEAAARALASSLLPRLPAGYRQMLGRRFEGGVDLSGGEWQKVALARAYMRDAQVLVLDEPTAALDARAEYEVFVRFSELTTARTAVLISHRFSTVRMADRIIVLQAGQLVDQGRHEDLVERSGLYSELFQLQAAGYR